jgi:hypothetical protein
MSTNKSDIHPFVQLKFQLFNADLRICAPGCTVNTKPYGLLSGTVSIQWKGLCFESELHPEVFAARGEGSCYILYILNVISKAELVPEFQHRRITHPALQGIFQELWGILLGTSIDPAASGLRQAISNHMFSNINRFRDHFTALPILSLQQLESKILQQLGKQRRIGMNIYDLACLVQMWALVFLQFSTHIDERFMAVLLDWLDHKVAILNLLQVTDHLTATPQFLHSLMIDLVHENSILLLKVLSTWRRIATFVISAINLT